MKCPKCSAAMDASTFSGMDIDRCTGCQGLWLNVDEFNKLANDDWLADYIDSGKKSGAPDTSGITEINCPECATPMVQEKDPHQPHIVYERCPKDCGVFFDAGEFKDLTNKSFWDKFKRRAKG